MEEREGLILGRVQEEAEFLFLGGREAEEVKELCIRLHLIVGGIP